MLFSNSGKSIANLVAKRCIACGQVWRTKDLQHGCCPDCRIELNPLLDVFCPGCGFVYASSGESAYLCLDCRQYPKPWSRFVFFNLYQGMLKDLIVDFKFNYNLGLSKLLQTLLWESYTLHHREFSPDALIPVPLHPKRLRQRGFNQSRELAKRVAAKEGVDLLPRALSRVRDTRSQVGLSREQREENLEEAIQVNTSEIYGKKVLLVDDIFTTGSTVRSCSEALNRAGAKSVDVLVLARAEE